MKIYKTLENQTIIDLCVTIYGSVNYLSQLIKDNNLNFNSFIPSGTNIYYQDTASPLPLNITTSDNVVSPYLAITSNPTGATKCSDGGNVTLNVGVNSTCSFKWQRSVSEFGVYTNLYDGANYTNTETANLTIITSTFEDHISGLQSYWYRCMINGYIYSTSALVEIFTAPTSIYIQEPTYPLTIHDTVTYSAVLDVYAGVSYIWYWSIDGINYTEIDNTTTFGSSYFTGFNTKDLIVNDVAYSLLPVTFECKAYQACGNVEAVSGPIDVTAPSFTPPVTTGLIHLLLGVDMIKQTGVYYNTHESVWSNRLNYIIGTQSYPGSEDPGYANTGFIPGGRARFLDNYDTRAINWVQSTNFGTYSVGATVYPLHDEYYSTLDDYGGLTSSITIMGVAEMNANVNPLWSLQNSGQANIISIESGTVARALLYFTDKLNWDTKGNVGSNVVDDTSVILNKPFVFTAQARMNGNDVALYVNGSTSSNTRTATNINTNNFTYSTYQPNIGNRIAGGYLMNGNIGAIAIYNRILNDTERQSMETWMNDYYGGNML